MDRIGPPTPLKLLSLIFLVPWYRWHYLIFGPRLDIIGISELENVLISGNSLVRWGDGETALARGKSISYQVFNDKLQIVLNRMLMEIQSNTVYGISWAYNSKIWDRKWNKRFFKILLSTRILWCAKFKPSNQQLFVETTIFYKLNEKLPLFLNAICKNKSVLLLASDGNYISVCPPGTQYIHCKSKDAFDDFKIITDKIDKWIDKNLKQKKIILSSIGPTSKAIWMHYTNSPNLQVIDVGHGFSFYLNGENSFAWKTDKGQSRQ